MIDTIVRLELILLPTLWLIWILRSVDIYRTAEAGFDRAGRIIDGNLVMIFINIGVIALNVALLAAFHA